MNLSLGDAGSYPFKFKMMKKSLLNYIILAFTGSILLIQIQANAQTVNKPNFMKGPEPEWVSKQMKSMTLEEKIGQLFFVAAYSNKDSKHENEIRELIKNQKVGGLIFFQGGPVKQVNLTRDYQQLSKTPLLIAMDAEWGPAMRLDSVAAWPFQMQLGALEDNQLIYQMGQQIAAQLKRMGVYLSFSPVVDVNSNPDNPVINHRSFGENPELVSAKSLAYMKGLQESGVLAVAKHFPGHGDTQADSHSDLPIIQKTKAEILSGEGIPYKKLISNGLSSVMNAHILLPKIDNDYPASLSRKIVTDMLKKEYLFEGLCFTDALNMKGAKMKNDKPGDMEVRAIIAGEDVLLMSEDVKAAVAAILQAVKQGRITEARINLSVKKILWAKYAVGLNKMQLPESEGLIKDLSSANYDVLNQQLRFQSITVVRNESMIPFKNLEKMKPLVVYLGQEGDDFIRMLNKYKTCQFVKVTESPDSLKRLEVKKLAGQFSHLIVVLESSTQLVSKKFGIDEKMVALAEELAEIKPSVLVVLGNPYILNRLSGLQNFKTVVVGYDRHKFSQEGAAQVLFGGLKARGRLPVSLKRQNLKAGDGLLTERQSRLGYCLPQAAGLNADSLLAVDGLAQELVDSLAAPGCQILIAKNGFVVYEKAFGFDTYEKKNPIQTNYLYDIASVTKIVASTPLLMHLQEEDAFHLDDSISKYLPMADSTNKSGMICRDILTHQAGLVPWIPFYKLFSDSDSLAFSPITDSIYTVRITDSLFMNQAYQDSIFKRILDSDTLKKSYKYSDLGYYLFQKWIESYTSKSLKELTDSLLYGPLGAERMTYLPLERFSRKEIVPTELDTVFRHELVHGTVHDPGAALLGGIGGHAGVFADANSLAKILQMYLWKGYYGDYQFLKDSTILEYTTAPFAKSGNRRGIGFDKPDLRNSSSNPVSDSVSASSYGHSGFTGTLVWVDPKYQLIYVFLSNRVCPDASNKKLTQNSYRSRIQDKIYQSIQ